MICSWSEVDNDRRSQHQEASSVYSSKTLMNMMDTSSRSVSIHEVMEDDSSDGSHNSTSSVTAPDKKDGHADSDHPSCPAR